MSHEPPIPEAARSPYPLQPPPISEQNAATASEARPADAVENGKDDAADQSWTERARDTFDRATESKVAVGAAVGIGSAALLAALLFTRRGKGRRDGTASSGATSGQAANRS